MDIKLLLLIVVLITVAAGVFYYFKRTFLNKPEPRQRSGQEEIVFYAELRHEYSLALQSGDKEEALAVGRKYYQNLRNGEPTESDEQAISRDLSLIKKV
jgi:flagellar basal body-associated protein FliL